MLAMFTLSAQRRRGRPRRVKSLGMVFGGLPRDPVFVQALSARAVTSWSVGVVRERVRTSRPR